MSKTNSELEKENKRLKTELEGMKKSANDLFIKCNDAMGLEKAVTKELHSVQKELTEAHAENDMLRESLNKKWLDRPTHEKKEGSGICVTFDEPKGKQVSVNVLAVCISNGIRNAIDMDIAETKRLSIALKNIFELAD